MGAFLSLDESLSPGQFPVPMRNVQCNTPENSRSWLLLGGERYRIHSLSLA